MNALAGTEDPPGSRLFIVCGRAVEVSLDAPLCCAAGPRDSKGRARNEPPLSTPSPHPPPRLQEELLRAAFRAYGVVQHVRVIRDKGGGSWRRPARAAPRDCALGGRCTAEHCTPVLGGGRVARRSPPRRRRAADRLPARARRCCCAPVATWAPPLALGAALLRDSEAIAASSTLERGACGPPPDACRAAMRAHR